MQLGLEGKVVLVTGGSKGIGLACARAFAAEGATVAIASRSEENLRRAAADGGVAARVAVDLTNAEAAQQMVREVEQAAGPIDVLINCAGAARRHLPADLDVHAWHAAMDAKYFTYMHAIEAALPGMVARRKGNVVNVIGMGGKVAVPIHLPGGAANSALMLATVGLAQVHGPNGIRINAINPGATLTDRVNDALQLEAAAQHTTVEDVLRRSQERIPLRRYATPEEVARVALFLGSDQAASYLTGVIIPMDGGASAVV